MIQSSLNRIKRNLINIPAVRISDKVVVFESDDWGSIRTPSNEVYQRLLKNEYITNTDYFARLDTLEKNEDLEMIFEVLDSVKDSRGNSAKLTANIIVGNPNFEAIKNSHFQEYFFEPVSTTINKYPDSSKVLDLWNEGAKHGVFVPQLHGREHVNISNWMENLQNNIAGFREAFEMNTYALNGKIAAAFNASSLEECKKHERIIKDAQTLFESYFGKKSETFIAPNYTWPKSLEPILKRNGVVAIQSTKKQNEPDLNGGMKSVYHFSGESNTLGQKYLVRNCLFEPSISPNADYVSACLRNISNAFYWKVPAIVGTHRINFVSRNSVTNRDNNLNNLRKLLSEIVKRWPDVVFLSSDVFYRDYLKGK